MPRPWPSGLVGSARTKSVNSGALRGWLGRIATHVRYMQEEFLALYVSSSRSLSLMYQVKLIWLNNATGLEGELVNMSQRL